MIDRAARGRRLLARLRRGVRGDAHVGGVQSRIGASRLWRALTVTAILAVIAWLDSPASPFALRLARPVAHASVFALIWSGIQALAGLLAAGAEITVSYVAAAVSWLAGRVATILTSTGSMFAKVWDGMRIVWSDALKPAIQWVDAQLKRLQAWLHETFKPVFDFLQQVRDRLLDFYKTFVRPVIDTIEYIRAINRVLLAFHITILQDFDKFLQELEARIEEPFLWINQQLNKVWNTLDLVVTANGFFQRLTLIRSMSRYAPNWMNGFWNRQIEPGRQAGTDYDRGRMYPLDAKWANGKELAQFYRGEPSRLDGDVARLVPVFRIAAGIDPPDGADDDALAA